MRVLVLCLLCCTASCSLWSVIQRVRSMLPKKMDDSMREPGIYRVNKWVVEREFFVNEDVAERTAMNPLFMKWFRRRSPIRRDRLYLQLKPDGFVKIHHKSRPLLMFQTSPKKPKVDIFKPLDDDGNDMLSELPGASQNKLKYDGIDGSWWWNGDPNTIVGPSIIRRSNIIHYFLVRLLSLTSRVKRISIETEEGGLVSSDGRSYVIPPVKYRHDAVLTFGTGVDEYGVLLQRGSIYGYESRSGGSSSSMIKSRVGTFTMRANGYRPMIGKEYQAAE